MLFNSIKSSVSIIKNHSNRLLCFILSNLFFDCTLRASQGEKKVKIIMPTYQFRLFLVVISSIRVSYNVAILLRVRHFTESAMQRFHKYRQFVLKILRICFYFVPDSEPRTCELAAPTVNGSNSLHLPSQWVHSYRRKGERIIMFAINKWWRYFRYRCYF